VDKEAKDGGLGLTTGAELYQSTLVPRLSVLQLRSMAAEGRRQAVAEELLTWAKGAGVAEIVIVSACSAHIRVDADLAAETDLRFVHCPASEGDDPRAPTGPDGAQLPVLPLGHGFQFNAAVDEFDSQTSPPFTAGSVSAALALLRGGGLARPLLRLAGNDAATEALCLLGFSSPAVDWQLTERLAKVLCLCVASRVGVQAPAFKVPPSWQFQAEATARQLWG
jgi:hypothetical protein